MRLADQTVVRYEPDKGASYAHALRPSGPRRAWQALQAFLQGCAAVEGPDQIKLHAYRATQFDDALVNDRCVDAALARFGTPDETVGGGFMFPSGEPVPGGYVQWRGDRDALQQYLDFLFAGDPWPKTLLGPVSLTMGYRFRWQTPDQGQFLNSLRVSLERRSFVEPILWFPFAPGDPRLADLVRSIAPSLPFKLSPRHFRVATPSKAGAGFVFRKFDATPLLAGL